MAKKQVEGQMDLIETIDPKLKRQLLKMAKEYRATLEERVAYLSQEVDLKNKIRDTLRSSGLQPVDNTGLITLVVDGIEIKMQPRDEKVSVNDYKEPKTKKGDAN